MNDPVLRPRLRRVAARIRWFRFWRALAAGWAASALIALALAWLQGPLGWTSPFVLPSVAGFGAAFAFTLALRQLTRPIDDRWLARRIEAAHPELDGLLLTAVQQTGDTTGPGGYFRERIIQEAAVRAARADWRDVLPRSRLIVGQAMHWVACGLFVASLSYLRVSPVLGEKPSWKGADGVTVTPGDTKLEKGESLVVLARFGSEVPASVSLVVRESGTASRTIPLVKSLADPVFGGSVPEVQRDLTYHVEYPGGRTPEFRVTVFEHPRLIRADFALTFPDYTRLPPRRIEDTRRVSAVEGTRLDVTLTLNKPVRSARLVGRGATKGTLELQATPDRPEALLVGHVPAASGTYELQLTDDEGRGAKTPVPFTIDVQPNRPPEIRLALPRGDVRPSALEEVGFEGTVWDDFGVLRHGLAYSLADGAQVELELGQEAPAREKRAFAHLLRLEELGAKPDDLVTWHAWAEDIGPDGRPRRTQGDLFFAEVRPFDEIFREQRQDSGEGEGGPQGQQAQRLTELQKQIISATWRLRRDGAKAGYAADAKVVLESQQQALTQAGEAAAEARGPRQEALWQPVIQGMERAVERLREAATAPESLAQALIHEQAAYQALLRLQSRETSVARRNRKQGGGGGGGGNQRQLDQLELEQSENRYETQRVARSPQNQERREQLAVMNRLQELARRQQDLNERLREVQASLQEAKTEAEREEAARRLRRLEEEQRQMLADADEIRQRMDRAENQASLANQRQQLEETRDQLRQAADAAAGGSVAQALASGSRAQRQLQEMRDELRRQNAGEFAEELRTMRGEARSLAQQQEEATRQLERLAQGGAAGTRKTLSGAGDRQELLDQLEGQKEQLNRLVERASRLSEQAENSEPLLSRQLYDSLRKVSQDDAKAVRDARDALLSGGALSRDLNERLQRAQEREEGGRAVDVTRELLRDGLLGEARQAGERSRGLVDELRRGVERAAERVLGDDAEQLKLARSELDALADQLQRELATAGAPGSGRPGEERQAAAGTPGGERPAGTEGSAPDAAGEPGRPGNQPGQTPGESVAGGSPGQPGAPGAGETPGEGRGNAGAPGENEGRGRSEARPAGERMAADGPRPVRRGGGAGGGRESLGLDALFNSGEERAGIGGGDFGGAVTRGPLTGEEFNRWSERLRDVEDLVESPELRNALASARERARLVRRDFRQERRKPDWASVQLQILRPLLEVRSRVAEDLARRESKDPLVPLDRDPVPARFAEAVRRYYEELGKDR